MIWHGILDSIAPRGTATGIRRLPLLDARDLFSMPPGGYIPWRYFNPVDRQAKFVSDSEN
jgi:hypothetical protein